MNLKAQLCSSPREGAAGPRSSTGTSYQLHWALARVLELYEQDVPFLVVFDYHDDVLICDSSDDPSVIEFVQVKTRDTDNWTAARLTKRQGAQFSPVGKLYHHRLCFGEAAALLRFVSNMRFKLKLGDGGESTRRDVIHCAEVVDPDQKRLVDAVQAEHSLPKAPDLGDLYVFERSTLALRGHEDQLIGVVTRFLNRRNPPGAPDGEAAYRTLLGEVRRRNDWSGQPRDFEELCARKGLSRRELDTMVARVLAARPTGELWARIDRRLTQERYSVLRIRQMRGAVGKMSAELLDPERSVEHELRDAIVAVLHDLSAEDGHSLAALLRIVKQRLPRRLDLTLYSPQELDAMILMALESDE